MGTHRRKSPSTSPPPKRRTVWKALRSIPGAVAATAAVLTAMVAIISQSDKIKNRFFPPKTLAELVHVELTNAPVFPFGLRELAGKKPYLKWFHITVDNASKYPLPLEVTFEVRRGPAIEIKGPPVLYYVPAHDRHYESDLDPNIKFLKTYIKPTDILEINYRVYDDQHKVIFANNTTRPEIKLLPDDVIDWTLTSLDGSPVPQKFLLASLTLWTVTADPSVKQLADELRRGIGPHVDMSLATRWFAQSYARVFQDSSQIHVMPASIAFPTPGRQTIRKPSRVLRDAVADPLEAALLLGALGRITFRKRLRLVLIAVPVAQDLAGEKNILLSWSVDSLVWHAVSLGQANSLSFKDNERVATSQVVKLLGDESEMLSSLNTTGVFLDKSRPSLALDFLRADQHFHITAWQ